MRYLGSKRRIAKDILPIILKDKPQDSVYIEPFVGAFNMMDKVSNTYRRWGNDIRQTVDMSTAGTRTERLFRYKYGLPF